MGAYILGGELAASAATTTEETAIRDAFDRYEGQMRPYVEQGQELPPGGADGYAPISSFCIAMDGLQCAGGSVGRCEA